MLYLRLLTKLLWILWSDIMQIWRAVLDSQTCDACRARHNKPFNDGMDKPPLHEECRCYLTNDTFEAQLQRFREACLKVMSEISKALKRDMDKFHKAIGYQRRIKKDMMRANGHKTKKTVPVSGGFKSSIQLVKQS